MILICLIISPFALLGLLCFLDIFGRAADDQQTTVNDWQTFDE